MVILSAVDGKRSTSAIIETGHSLATAYQDNLKVLHVIPETDARSHFDDLQLIPDFSDFGFGVELERAETVAQRLIDSAIPDAETGGVTPVGRVGDPGDEILSLADELDARYLVIGGRKRTPAGKAIFGSVTQRVILDSERPVVTRMATN